jgi:hypothetical protein
MQTIKSTNNQELGNVVVHMKARVGNFKKSGVEVNNRSLIAVKEAIEHLETLLYNSNSTLS